MSDRVSVLITCYNYGAYLQRCLESVFSQTRLPDEVVVVDDGSEDDTPKVARKFGQVRYVRQKNQGYAAASNRAVAESSGEILCHLDADDFWFPTKLERVLGALDRNVSLGGVIHDKQDVDESDRPLPTWRASSAPMNEEWLTLSGVEGSDFLYPPRFLKPRMFGSPTTLTVRRSSVVDLFPLPERPSIAVDAFLLYGALRHGVLYLPEALAGYRLHGSNMTGETAGRELLNVRSFRQLADNPVIAKSLSRRHRDFLRAAAYERIAYIASRTRQDRIEGALAGLRVPTLTWKHGIACHWKHLVLPVLCLLPALRNSNRVKR